MDLKIFALINKNYKCVEGVFVAPNVSLAIRDNFQSWSMLYPALVDDYFLVELGKIPRDVPDETDVTLISPSSKIVPISWNDYENEIEYVPKHLSERQKELMRQQTQSQLDQISALQERIERSKMMSSVQKASMSNSPDE